MRGAGTYHSKSTNGLLAQGTLFKGVEKMKYQNGVGHLYLPVACVKVFATTYRPQHTRGKRVHEHFLLYSSRSDLQP